MLEKGIFRNRFVIKYNSGDFSLLEFNYARNEGYVYVSDGEKVDIYLKNFFVNPIKDSDYFVSLKQFFEERNINESEFKNPFTRRSKIIKTLDDINKEKNKVKVKK